MAQIGVGDCETLVETTSNSVLEFAEAGGWLAAGIFLGVLLAGFAFFLAYLYVKTMQKYSEERHNKLIDLLREKDERIDRLHKQNGKGGKK